MRIGVDAISIIERAFIMRVLRTQHNWEARRRGAHIRIFEAQTPKGPEFRYRVGRGTRNVGGQAPSVGEVVDEINGIVAGQRTPVKYQLPYKDNDEL